MRRAASAESHYVGDANRCSARSVIEHGGHQATSEAGRSTSGVDERQRTTTPGRRERGSLRWWASSPSSWSSPQQP